jgi:DNA invertase Pin-like site-specific DNA recombinase
MKRRPTRTNPTDLTDLRAGLYVRVSAADAEDKAKKKRLQTQHDVQKLIAKQTEDQKKVGLEWAEREGVNVVDVYSDPDFSASRFGTKERPEYARLLRDVAAGKLDLLWFWELSRSQRQLKDYAHLRDLCRDQGVRWVIRDRVYDPDDYRDMLPTTILAAVDEVSSEQTSERVERGKRFSAQAGKRPGRAPYGYRARYDPDGTPHDEPDQYDGEGVPIADSPADVVKEIFARILAGHSITNIRHDLDKRGITTTAGYPWANSKIRGIATNPAYIGKRVHQVGDGIRQTDRVKAILPGVETEWPALVDEETFWEVHRILDDPARKTTRNGPRTGVYLLSGIARCAECGGKLAVKKTPANNARTRFKDSYSCRERVCVGIGMEALDLYVEDLMVTFLCDPRVLAYLTKATDSPAAALARADLVRLRAELDEVYRQVRAGRLTAMMATASEAGYLERIREAEQQIAATTPRSVLRGTIGPEAADKWAKSPMEVKRAIIRETADIRVHRVGHGGRGPDGGPVPARDRVTWRWLLGPDAA